LGVKLAGTSLALRALPGSCETAVGCAPGGAGASLRTNLMVPLLIGYARVSTDEQI
jgi:hypothetical protein